MMLPGYGGIQEINILYVCASTFLSNGLLIGLFLTCHSHSLEDAWLESKRKEIDEIANRDYNEYVKIDVNCPECGAKHTQLPLFSEHKDYWWLFKCENQNCTNTIAISSLDPKTQIVASTLIRRVS